jgi:hypothetical protein
LLGATTSRMSCPVNPCDRTLRNVWKAVSDCRHDQGEATTTRSWIPYPLRNPDMSRPSGHGWPKPMPGSTYQLQAMYQGRKQRQPLFPPVIRHLRPAIAPSRLSGRTPAREHGGDRGETLRSP